MKIQHVTYGKTDDDSYIYRYYHELDGRNKNKIGAVKFFNGLCINTINCFTKYFERMHDNWDDPHGFMFGELQTHTYITPALFDLCRGAVMREHPIDRVPGHKTKTQKRVSGRADYWCEYGQSRYLIEVKQKWIRYRCDRQEPTVYAEVYDALDEAIKQLDDIDLPNTILDPLTGWGLALVLVPVFVKDKKEELIDSELCKLKGAVLFNQVREKAFNSYKKNRPNILACWEVGEKHMTMYKYEEEGDQVCEKYPMVFFLGHFKRIIK